MINGNVKCESGDIKRQSLKQDPGETASQFSSFINSGADVCEAGSDRQSRPQRDESLSER